MTVRRHCSHPYATGTTCGLYATGGAAYCGAHQRPHFEKERRARGRARLRDAIADVAVEFARLSGRPQPGQRELATFQRLRGLVAALDVFDRTGAMPRATARRLKEHSMEEQHG